MPNYHLKLEKFEGPFDLLLFFIERDELDIYDIPISKIIADFLHFIQLKEKLNIEISSEFILFVATLMKIKSKMLLPRKEKDLEGNEIDPRQGLVEKILEYKQYKMAALQLAIFESDRMAMLKRGNAKNEVEGLGEMQVGGAEIQSLTLFKLMKSFEMVLLRLKNKDKPIIHTVLKYNFSMEESKRNLLYKVEKHRQIHFDELFKDCETTIQALFYFLSLLELSQLQFMRILNGEGLNNFIVEWNENMKSEGQDFKNISNQPSLF